MTQLSDYFPTLTADDFYTPAMMEFDGSTGYYSKTGITTSGNAHTIVFKFKIGAFTGGSLGVIFAARGATSQPLILAQVISDDHANADIRGKLSVLAYNNAGTPICRLYTPTAITDDNDHTCFFTFNGTAGTAEFIMDSVDVDDTGNASRITPTTGTMDSGAASSVRFGLNEFTTFYFPGQIGFAGYDDVGGLDYTDFMTTTGPKALDETTWREWGSQPLFWNPMGDMSNNLGSAGDMTRNGTIDVAYGEPAIEVIPPYTPAMMEYDGATGYYSKASVSVTGNSFTLAGRIKCSSSTATRWVNAVVGPSGQDTGDVVVLSSTAATADEQNKLVIYAKNAAGIQILRLISILDIADDATHTYFVSYDATAGSAIFYIDGVNADNVSATNRTLTTGTLDRGSSTCTFGANAVGAALFDGDLGFIGMSPSYLTNYSDFMTGSSPKDIESTLSTVWGGTPLFWNEHGDMENNQGSAGNMTRNGTIVVGRGGN